MKITKQKLKQIIKEELADEDSKIELSFEDRDRFYAAYTLVGQAVDAGTLPESVEDAVHEMLHLLGIHV